MSGAPKRIGAITLIWGNGCDVVSDCSDVAVIVELLGPSEKYAEGFEKRAVEIERLRQRV
jgi:hypothetical protein